MASDVNELDDNSTNKYRKQVENFLTETQDARTASERDRDYYDGKQWTNEQIATLKARKQAPIVINRIKPKVKGIKGLSSMRQTDPKAYPRTQKHEDASHAVTDALRYVADNNKVKRIKQKGLEELLIEGYTGSLTTVDGKMDENDEVQGDIEIKVELIHYDRLYFDTHSREEDFSDAGYKGYFVWMYTADAARIFDMEEATIAAAAKDDDDETFEDRPRWMTEQGDRVRVAHHYYLEDGKWMQVIFTGDLVLQEAEQVPYVDEDGDSVCPLEITSLYVDRDNNRYGEVRDWIDPQDEINHRRSKFLFLLSSRQTAGREGAIDVKQLKRELAKPDGHIQFKGDKANFEILNTNDMSNGQFTLYQDAKGDLDAISFNAQLSGERQGDLSGVAIDKLQMAGTLELNDVFDILNEWEKAIYTQIWYRIRQFWDEEKWIRVTDDRNSLRWVGFNVPITVKDQLEELVNDDTKPDDVRLKAGLILQNAVQNQDPALGEVIMVKNPVPELEMDIILDQTFDSINTQQEQFKLMAELYPTGDIDIIHLLKLSSLRNKDEIIEDIEKSRQSQAQTVQAAAQIDAINAEADAKEKIANATLKEQQAIEQQLKNMKTMNGTEDAIKLDEILAKTAKTNQEAVQKGLENAALLTQPVDTNPQLII